MMKDSKVLLVTTVICTVTLAVFQYILTMQAVSVNLRAAQELNKSVQRTPSPSPSVAPTASSSATPKGKVTATSKATVKPTATPEATVEASPAE